jgi:hypothetical protein
MTTTGTTDTLTAKPETYKGRKGRRYMTGHSWIIRNADGKIVGRAERYGASRAWADSANYVTGADGAVEFVDERFYNIQIDGLPYNPRRYPSLAAALRHASAVYSNIKH